MEITSIIELLGLCSFLLDSKTRGANIFFYLVIVSVLLTDSSTS